LALLEAITTNLQQQQVDWVKVKPGEDFRSKPKNGSGGGREEKEREDAQREQVKVVRDDWREKK
jgi:hypothetical protein